MKIVLVWFALVGIWPFFDPEHDMVSLTSRIDVAVHAVAIAALLIGVYVRIKDLDREREA